MPGIKLEDMIPDEETGFLPSPYGMEGFGVKEKKVFLELMMSENGHCSISKIAELLKIAPNTVLSHIRRDKAFAERVAEAKSWFAERVEGVLQSCALDPKKTIDRIAFLRAYKPEKYARNEVSHATVEVKFDFGALQSFRRKKVVDTEIVDLPPEQAPSKTVVVQDD